MYQCGRNPELWLVIKRGFFSHGYVGIYQGFPRYLNCYFLKFTFLICIDKICRKNKDKICLGTQIHVTAENVLS